MKFTIDVDLDESESILTLFSVIHLCKIQEDDKYLNSLRSGNSVFASDLPRSLRNIMQMTTTLLDRHFFDELNLDRIAWVEDVEAVKVFSEDILASLNNNEH